MDKVAARGWSRALKDGSNPFVLPFWILAIVLAVVGVGSLIKGQPLGALAFIGTAVCIGLHFATNSASRRMARKADEME